MEPPLTDHTMSGPIGPRQIILFCVSGKPPDPRRTSDFFWNLSEQFYLYNQKKCSGKANQYFSHFHIISKPQAIDSISGMILEIGLFRKKSVILELL